MPNRFSSRVRQALLAAVLACSVAQQAAAKDTITFVAATFAEAGRGEKLRAWIAQFNASQADVEVQAVSMPFSTLASTVFTQMGGGGGPDLVRFDLQDFYAAVAADRVLPLDDIVPAATPNLNAADRFMQVGGKRYGVAFELSNYVLLYNKALVPTPPATFPEFLAAAKEATKDGRFGFAFRATLAERAGFWQDLCNFVYGHGGRWSDRNGNLTLNDPKVIEGVAAYKQMYDSGAIPRGADAATYRRMFWEGKLAMEIDNGGVATIFNQQAPDLQLGAAPSPFPDRAQGQIIAPLIVNANTKKKEAAAVFLRWMLTPVAQAGLLDVMGAGAVAVKIDRPAEDLARRPWLAAYDAQTPNSLPQLPEGFEVKTPEIQQIVLEQVLRVLQGGVEPKAAMDEAQRRGARAAR